MAFFDEIDCELDESFILHSEEGKYVWIIFFNFRASNRLPSDLRVRSTSDQIDSSPWRWWNLQLTQDRLINEWTSSKPIIVKSMLSGKPSSEAWGAEFAVEG